MNTELAQIASQISKATQPEEIFGSLQGSAGEQAARLKKIYHQLAKVAHPDVYAVPDDKDLAQQCFTALARWYGLAGEKIRDGVYGKSNGSAQAILLQAGKRSYTVQPGFTASELYNIYPCRFDEAGHGMQAILKIVRDPKDNDLALHEARILGRLAAGREAHKFSTYIPNLVDAFLYVEAGLARQALVCAQSPGWYSLEEVRQAYPHGIDPKDMAWIWRRLLVALGFAHINGVIHGAALPRNIYIQAEEHGLVLDGWHSAICDADSSGERLSSLDPAYAGWYPPEAANETPLPGIDIFLAAKCMIYLLGGDPITQQFPSATPKPFKAFLKGCLLPGMRRRPQDAWRLKEEFDELLHKLWGERKFHPFYMPVKV